MAAQVVKDAFAGRLVQGVTDLPMPATNTSEAPKDGSAYMVLQFPVTNSEPITVGAPGENIYRDTGVARVVINVPSGSGLAQAGAWADQICNLFRGATFEGVRCYAPSAGPEDDRNDNGVYYQQSVVIPYEFDHYG